MNDQASIEQPATSAHHAERFLINVIWGWVSVITNFVAGIFLSPYMIRQLGPERYGIWVLAFSLIEYFFIFDLGFRSAIVNHNSQFWTKKEFIKINEVINTTLVYFTGIAALIISLTFYFSGQVHRYFIIKPEHQSAFAVLVTMTGTSWAMGMLFNVFSASLEAFQQFKIQNRIYVLSLLIRTAGCFTVLALGYKLVGLGAVVVTAQGIGYILAAMAVKRILPTLEFSWRYVSRARWRQLFEYGISSFAANTAQLSINQGPSILIGHFLPEANVGYYGLPNRLLQYAGEAMTRIGFVTAPNTAQMLAEGRQDQVVQLGMYLNRYCFSLFMPLALFLFLFGSQLLTVWVGAEMARHSAPLLIASICSYGFVMAGQYNSASILFGLAKHQGYARNVMIEAAALFGGLIIVIPRFGLLGAAWLVASLMIIIRGLGTPWMLCRYLDFPFLRYMRSIYLRPLLAAMPALAVGLLLKSAGLSGRNWRELFLGGAAVASSFLVASWWICIEPEHRLLLRSWVGRRLKARFA